MGIFKKCNALFICNWLLYDPWEKQKQKESIPIVRLFAEYIKSHKNGYVSLYGVWRITVNDWFFFFFVVVFLLDYRPQRIVFEDLLYWLLKLYLNIYFMYYMLDFVSKTQ